MHRMGGKGEAWRTEAMRSYSQPVLIWFTRGQGRITISGVTRGYGPHNLIYLPAGTMHGFEMNGHVYGSVVFMPIDKSLNLPDEALHMRFRETIQQNELSGLIDQLQREQERPAAGQDRAVSFLAGLIAVWLERQVELMPDYEMNPDASRRLTAAFTALVEEEFREGYSVSHYAAELGVTPTHLSRACNVACGLPASAILADRVHFEARKMLLDTRMQVKDIADALGFRSAAYFTRAFHKHTGVSPSAFRKRAV